METTIHRQTNLRTIVITAIASFALVVSAHLCTHFTRTTAVTAPTTTMRWNSDTSWVKGGWR